jgi:hypothetical protein
MPPRFHIADIMAEYQRLQTLYAGTDQAERFARLADGLAQCTDPVTPARTIELQRRPVDSL